MQFPLLYSIAVFLVMPTATNMALENSSLTANPESDSEIFVDPPMPENVSEEKSFSELIPDEDASKMKKLHCGTRCHRREPLLSHGDCFGVIPLEKTWSTYCITVSESFIEMLACCEASYEGSPRSTISVRSLDQKTMRTVTRKLTGKEKAKSRFKGPTKIALFYDGTSKGTKSNIPDQRSLGDTSAEPLLSISLDWLDLNRTLKIWDVAWGNHLHLSHGRFPAGGLDQSLHNHALGQRTQEPAGPISDSDNDEAVVEEEIVIIGEPEILVGAPPVPMSHEHRLNSFSLCPIFKKKFYFVAGDLARCGFILMRNEKIKCADANCSAEHFLPDVLKRLSREVVWHIAECHFSAVRRPCAHCVGMHEARSECGKCGQTMRAERTFHHVAMNPEQSNSRE